MELQPVYAVKTNERMFIPALDGRSFLSWMINLSVTFIIVLRLKSEFLSYFFFLFFLLYEAGFKSLNNKSFAMET